MVQAGCSPPVTTADVRSGQLTGRHLEAAPGFVAELALPLIIEARFLKDLPEWSGLGLVEDHALGGQLLFNRSIELGDIDALRHSRVIEVLGNDVLDICWQSFPSPPIS